MFFIQKFPLCSQWDFEFILKGVLSRNSHINAQYAAYGIAGLEERLEHWHDVDGANQIAIIKFALPAFGRTVIKYVLDHRIVIGEVLDGDDIFQRLIDDFVCFGKAGICSESVVAAENGEVAVDPENTDVWEVEK